MVLPKKVSRKFRKEKKTGKKLKGGSGRVKSDTRRITSEEAKIARLGKEARETIKKQKEIGNTIATMFKGNESKNTGLNNELYKLNLETDEKNLEEKIKKNQNLITTRETAKKTLNTISQSIETDIQNLSDEIKNLKLRKKEIELKPSVNENNTSRINAIDAVIEQKEEIKKKKEEEKEEIKKKKQKVLKIIAQLQQNKKLYKE